MSNLATVQRIYEAFGRGDVPAILAPLADDVQWEHRGLDHGIPWLKPGRGRDHVLGFFKVIGAEFEISRFDLKALVESGSTVIALIDIEARIRSTGKSIRDDEVHLWGFDKQGRVATFRHVVDTHQHLQASRK